MNIYKFFQQTKKKEAVYKKKTQPPPTHQQQTTNCAKFQKIGPLTDSTNGIVKDISHPLLLANAVRPTNHTLAN